MRAMPTFVDNFLLMANSDYKILIVDDEPDIIEFITYNLEKEDFKVVSASDGLAAIERAEEEQPDLILLDIMMPELDGVEVCRKLRTKPEMDESIIAFLTARNEDFTLISALEAGGDDFITKPIRPRVLISRVRALLRRKDRLQQGTADQLVFGHLTIDKEKVQITVDGREVDLARKEFELLLLLVSKPGKVFTRDEIFRRVWGRDVIVGNRTIDVHIRKLREKIGDAFIKTIKGIGYKFEF